MKTAFKILNLILLVTIFSLSGCKKDDDPAPEDPSANTTSLLSKTWQPGTILFGGEVPPAFDGFTVTFQSNKTYSSMEGAPVFRNSGTWDYVKGNSNELLLNRIMLDNNPDFIMEVSRLDETQLDFLLEMKGTPNGRIGGLNNDYNFSLLND